MNDGNGLPDGWEFSRIDELGSVQLGRQRSPGKRSDKFPTKYLRAGNVTWNGLALDDVLEMEFTPTERETFKLRCGDILLSEASGSASEVGKPAVWNDQMELCCFQNTLIRFRPIALQSRYALHLFSHLARSGVFVAASRGVGIHHIGAQRFSALDVPVPPLAEQDRIADRVDECLSDLDAGVAALERTRRKLKRYRSAVLHAAVTGKLTAEWRKSHSPPAEPGDQLLARILKERREQWEARTLAKFEADGREPPNSWRDRYPVPVEPKSEELPELPEGWRWASLDALTWGSSYGTSTKCDYNASGVPVLRIPNIARGELDLSDIKRSTADLNLSVEEQITPGDMLVCRTNGSIRLIGKSALVISEFDEPHYFASYLIRFRHNYPSIASFVQTAFESPYGRSFIESHAASSAGQHNVSMTLLQQFPIPLPPICEQTTIGDRVEEKLSQIDAMETEVARGLARASRLRQAILKAAFAGKLVPQDPCDEPASILLERVRGERASQAESAAPKRPRKKVAKKTAKKIPPRKKATKA